MYWEDRLTHIHRILKNLTLDAYVFPEHAARQNQRTRSECCKRSWLFLITQTAAFKAQLALAQTCFERIIWESLLGHLDEKALIHFALACFFLHVLLILAVLGSLTGSTWTNIISKITIWISESKLKSTQRMLLNLLALGKPIEFACDKETRRRAASDFTRKVPDSTSPTRSPSHCPSSAKDKASSRTWASQVRWILKWGEHEYEMYEMYELWDEVRSEGEMWRLFFVMKMKWDIMGVWDEDDEGVWRCMKEVKVSRWVEMSRDESRWVEMSRDESRRREVYPSVCIWGAKVWADFIDRFAPASATGNTHQNRKTHVESTRFSFKEGLNKRFGTLPLCFSKKKKYIG